MNKVKVLVVEDEFIVAEEIAEILNQNDFEVVGKASNAEQALKLARETNPDIALLDIHIDGEMDGIDAAHKIREPGNTAIIFLSAFDDKEYLERASEVEPAAYIVKPFEARNLIVAIKLAFKKLENSQDENDQAFFVEDRIFIREGNKFNKLMVNTIQFAAAVGSYTDIYTPDRKITLTMNLKQFEAKLHKPEFIRVHRSYLVNVEAIDSLEGNIIHIGAHHIPISASHKDDFLKSIRTI